MHRRERRHDARLPRSLFWNSVEFWNSVHFLHKVVFDESRIRRIERPDDTRACRFVIPHRTVRGDQYRTYWKTFEYTLVSNARDADCARD